MRHDARRDANLSEGLRDVGAPRGLGDGARMCGQLVDARVAALGRIGRDVGPEQVRAHDPRERDPRARTHGPESARRPTPVGCGPWAPARTSSSVGSALDCVAGEG